MNKNLKNYLENIDHYLILSKGKKEILKEIENHILEKTETDLGEITEDNIQQTISSFGTAQEVAEKYSEGYQIISPAYKNYLFRYTWFLFALHYIFKLISYLFDLAFHLSPFGFSIEIKVFYHLLSEAPATWIYSFGIVTLVLYFITQSEKKINLIWPEIAIRKFKIKTVPLPKPSRVMIMVKSILLVIALLVYSKYGTIFFMTVNFHQAPIPLFTDTFSQVMSLLVIVLIVFELICSLVPYFIKSYWISLINNLVHLAVAVFLLKNPFTEIFADPSLYVLKPIGSFILIGAIVMIVWDIFKTLISMVRRDVEKSGVKK